MSLGDDEVARFTLVAHNPVVYIRRNLRDALQHL